MKRCPQCGREYDLSMSYCLDDGSELLYGPGAGIPGDEAATVLFAGAARLGISESETAIHGSGDHGSEVRNSIAVLPFANMSADEENEFFCDGLAEELLNSLSKVEDLKV